MFVIEMNMRVCHTCMRNSLNLGFHGGRSSRVHRVNRVHRSRVPVSRGPSAAAASLGTCFQACGSGLEVGF